MQSMPALAYVDVRAVAVDPVIPSNIYAGMGGAASSIPLFKSADGGASWTSLAQFHLGGSTWYGWISSLLVGSASPNVDLRRGERRQRLRCRVQDHRWRSELDPRRPFGPNSRP